MSRVRYLRVRPRFYFLVLLTQLAQGVGGTVAVPLFCDGISAVGLDGPPIPVCLAGPPIAAGAGAEPANAGEPIEAEAATTKAASIRRFMLSGSFAKSSADYPLRGRRVQG